MEWRGNEFESSMKVVMCMKSHGAAGCLSQEATFYEEGIQELVPRYDKCLNNGENNVEK
jgi:hypothetical protein